MCRDITERKRAEEEREQLLRWRQGVTQLQHSLLEPDLLENKLKRITDSIVRIFDADFCRIWLIRPGDRCERDCLHARVHEGPHVCRYRDKCLHLLSSSGRYTHTDGESHRRVPFGSYMIGRIASDEDRKFITNDVQNDPRVHNHEWARELGLVSFAGYRLHVPGEKTLGVLALFAKQPIPPAEDAMLDGLGSAVAMVVKQAVAEESLKKSEARFRSYFELSGAGIAITSPTTDWVEVNDRLCEMFGYSREELRHKTWPELTYPEDMETDLEHFNQIMKGVSDGYSIDKRFICRNGNIIWTSLSVHCVRLDDGNADYFIALIFDITERKQAEDELKKTEEKFRSYVDNAPDGIFVVNSKGMYLDVNREACKTTGYSQKELLNKSISDLLPPNAMQAGMKSFQELLENGSMHVELPYLTKSGEIRYWSIDGTKLSDDKYLGFTSDITERKKTEKALQDSEERYRTLFESAGEGILIADIETKKFRYANSAVCNMFGYNIEELLEMGVADIHPKEDLELIVSGFEAQARGEITVLHDIPCLKKDGTVFYADISTEKAVIDEKECNIGFFTDITERKQAEDEIKKLAKFPSENPNPVMRVTTDGTIIYANKAASNCMKLFKCEINQPLPENLREFLADAVSSGVSKNYEINIDDKVFTITFAPVPDSGYINLYGRDITDRKRAEEELTVSEEKLQSVFNASPDSITVLDLDGTILDCNPVTLKMLAFTSKEEIIGRSVFDLVVQHEQKTAIESFNETIEKGILEGAEFTLVKKDGQEFPGEVSAGVIHDQSGNVKSIVVLSKDITERKKAEQERQNLITAFEHTYDSITVADRNRSLIFVNSAFERMTGYSREEVIGRTPDFLFTHEEVGETMGEIDKKLTSKEVITLQTNIQCKDGAKKLHEITLSPVLDKTGVVINTITVGRDITEKAITEQRIRESQKMEAIGTLAGGIAHDFNNILTAIIGFTELSLDEVPEESQLHSDLTKIFKAGYRARDLVNQILTFSRQREREKHPILIAPIIKESLKLLRASLPTSIEIRQSIEQEPGTVLADPTQIHQVIMNLCTNAGHAMREKGGILEVSLCSKELDSEFCVRHPGLTPGLYLKLMVSDTGHGIAPDILPKIFEPYFTTKDKSGGTGLGLSVVHGIVSGCDGAVTVYSEPGKGTTFKVYLPVIMKEPVSEVEKTKPVLKGHERILLIDDERDIVDVGKRILEQLGYTVTTMTNSMEALDLFQKDPYQFDLVISDMTMPFMTGDELAEEFMRIRQDIPFVICTGFSEKLTEEKALSIGIKAYLGKPLLKSEMAETIRKVLDEKSEGT